MFSNYNKTSVYLRPIKILVFTLGKEGGGGGGKWTFRFSFKNKKFKKIIVRIFFQTQFLLG